MKDVFFETGWRQFPFDPLLAGWVRSAAPAARHAINAQENARWMRCEGTWFAGVNVLPNDLFGAIGDGPELAGTIIDFIRNALKIEDLAWDRAQISVLYPEYPKPMEQESESAYQYRRNRDAAHLDGLLPEGPDRRRHLREYHSFILGIPLVDVEAGTSPFVVWEGSHEIMRKALRTFFAGTPPDKWSELDVTDIYHETRRLIFKDCNRVEITCGPGESYLVHRLALHGVAPWKAKGGVAPNGRTVAYFRPELSGPEKWLNAP